MNRLTRLADTAAQAPKLTMKETYDLLVIGAGSAGFAAAIKGSELGHRVGLIGDGQLGGTCVNVGCVPSKTLIRAAAAWHQAGHHPFAGLNNQQTSLDWPSLRNQKDALVASMRSSKYGDVLAAYPDIDYLHGRATFQSDGSVDVSGRRMRADKYIVATGAQPRVIPFPGVEAVKPLTSTTLMDLEELPQSLIILGGRAVALELGQTMARLGVKVVILQRSPRLLPVHEPEISDALRTYLEQEGIQVLTGVQVDSLGLEGDKQVVRARVRGNEEEFPADRILMALGRQANTSGLGLDRVDVDLADDGAILVDEYMQSSNANIFAVGDVTTYPEYVYVAAASGSIAAQNALGAGSQLMDLSVLPGVIFTDPQVATVGLTEAKASAQGYSVKSSRLDLEHVARARVARDTRGFIKLIADAETDQLLGAHILAADGGEVVQSAAVAMKFGAKVSDLSAMLFPYLTQVEGLKLAALAFGKDVTKLSCCAG